MIPRGVEHAVDGDPPGSGIAIEPAGAANRQEVHRLFSALHQMNAGLDPAFALSDDWPRILDEHLDHVRRHDCGATMLAWVDTRAVGLLMMDGHADSPLFRERHWAELLALYVVPEERGRGVARALLRAGLEWSRERGFDRVQLYVTASNVAARRFYRGAGFRQVQEIWRARIDPASAIVPEDPWCEAVHADGHHLVTQMPHAFALGQPAIPATDSAKEPAMDP